MYRSIGRSVLACIVLAVGLLAGCDTDAAVRVRGYTRKDGTYVQPHYRSHPDGNFSNNWSTKGNQNPYTGKWGTRVTPPNGYGGRRATGYGASSTIDYSPSARWTGSTSYVPAAPPKLSDEEDRGRREAAAKLMREEGYNLAWNDHTLDEFVDFLARIRLAQALAAQGIQVKWEQHTLSELQWMTPAYGGNRNARSTLRIE